ncbi:MAG: SDR family NAD(P)-dependent oxidoreductase, partial [Steroidobacteraceae bacterium]
MCAPRSRVCRWFTGMSPTEAGSGRPSAEQPVALVTGGAGGLGDAITRALAAAGFRVAVGYHRSAAAAAQLAAA